MRHATLLLLVGALGCSAELEDDIGVAEQAFRWPENGIAAALDINAISANPDNNQRLANYGMMSAFDNMAMRAALTDPLVNDANNGFMAYFVSSALAAGDSITVTDSNSVQRTFYGALGLCPSWKFYAPSVACKEAVSADLAARHNPTNTKIKISQRGPLPGGGSLGWQDPVTPVTESRPGVTIPSMNACATTTYGLARNCGWKLPPAGWGGVGTCVPGNPVTVSAVNGSVGWSSGDTMLRICRGEAACDSSTAIGANDDSVGLQPSVAFTCPSTGPGKGVFSVMWAPYASSNANDTAWPLANVSSYPAPEIGNSYAVWKYREGAFFGNMFEGAAGLAISVSWNPGTMTRSISVTDPSAIETVTQCYLSYGCWNLYYYRPFKHMYSCTSPKWTVGQAMDRQRVCASSDEVYQQTGNNYVCASRWVGVCHVPSSPTNVCDVDQVSDETYRSCHADGTTFGFPISTNLDDPCTIATGSACSYDF
jgi:hypothetical protein